ncbi:type IV pilus twitching motility protein PilT [Clostridium cochlearium]|uniref:Pili retraction protein pilT n=1 Tax=Clostridium cochlearium TaxID=1494 RepID=A0A239ZRZ5_CLOCO|nr:type IV pilus twitching motility protein PilT [Clostridium cochlearium]NSJ90720.1 type IV pilus twitching motility protein PilT [Coprococcus sp. MSK.21.13]MBE6064182.1 type IV pilus twitching motility protein PilT [Clostridium cochlearium]MBU5269379.1 type IV pilus twitching motility protein PilT [Clostridium cochlearium]MCR1972336.1 type IV pilus twitching motility protein PilT [Clostridium cochlearium]MDU1442442.1 type IV pilus twitching motility protein PilT [Clostridium cochlearium]
MESLSDLLDKTLQKKGSDLHLTVGVAPTIRVNGELTQISDEKLKPKELEKYAQEILKEDFQEYCEIGEADTSFSIPGLGRFRVNVFKQRGSHAIAIRIVGVRVPSLNTLDFPKTIKELSLMKRGLILVTGPAGSGKSTTLAAMINEINLKRSAHIITLEDPIEYLHKHNNSIVNQREIGKDTKNYTQALRAVLREDPDVILVGEMRDLETISIALTAAETGHLVLSSLHTIGAAKTIDRIIDVFPSSQQQQIRIQLATVLKGIVSQQLVPRKDGDGRIAALEIMIANNAIQNMIREGKVHQIESSIQTGIKYGMKTMDMALAELYKKELISYDNAIAYSMDREMIKKMIYI